MAKKMILYRSHFRLLLLFTCCLVTFSVQAQYLISGRVTSKLDGGPIPGVVVFIKGTSIGTTTDFDGKFELDVPDLNENLTFNFIGLVPETVAIDGREYLEVTMKEDCHVDFFDGRAIDLYALVGTIQNTFGGKLGLAIPTDLLIRKSQPWTLYGGLTYQSDWDNTDFLRSNLEFRHFAFNCQYSMDLKLGYRTIDFNRFYSDAYSIETELNYKKYTIIAGYSRLQQDLRIFPPQGGRSTYTAPLVGLKRSFYIRPVETSIMGKVALYGDHKEIEGELSFAIRKLKLFVNYYEFDTFSEFSAGVGMNLSYSLKRKS